MILTQYLSGLGKSFLKNDILSVDIGFTNIKMVHARKKTDYQLKIINYGIGDTPPGCIRNGVIYDIEGIVANLRKVMQEHKINEKNVKIVISAGSNIISKIILIEKTTKLKLERAVKEELSKDIPVNVEEHKLFYRVTGETEKEGISFHKVLVTLVPNRIIDNYIKVIHSMDFNPLSVEIPFSSVARFFSRGVTAAESLHGCKDIVPADIDKGATAVVDLGSETTNLSILNNGTLEFNRIILTGGRCLDELLSTRLDVDRKEAERFKKIYGISACENKCDDLIMSVGGCIEEYMDEILKNVKRSIEFYVEQCGGSTVNRIVFIGGGSALKGLNEFSEKVTGIPSFTIDMLSLNHIEFESYLNRDKLRFLINAVGISF